MMLPAPRLECKASSLRRSTRILICLFLATAIQASAASASTLSTTNAVDIAAFQSGRTVLGFDEIVVPPGPCYVLLDRNQYAAQGILISAKADGTSQTHVARLPDCGHFGATQSLPNIIGGGTSAGSPQWRESIRFDFPTPATAIGAHSDASGSNTTLTAYRANGTVITSVSGNQGLFLGIAEPAIAYAVWSWNADQAVAGFSLDNVTFSVSSSVPGLSWVGYLSLAMGLGVVALQRVARSRSAEPIR